jgi:hypothetical protein
MQNINMKHVVGNETTTEEMTPHVYKNGQKRENRRHVFDTS